MGVRLKLILTGVGAVAAAMAVALLVRDAHPVLIRMPFGLNQETGDHNYVLFNPFRDRSPERVAEAYLEAMRRGDCADAGKLSTNPILQNGYTCEGLQGEYSNVRDRFAQRLRDRRENMGEVILYYSNSGEGVEGNWIGMRRFGGEWRVVGFNKIW